MDLKEVSSKSKEIREKYHNLERKFHDSEWTIEEDALAYLTDAALVGRLTMDKQGRWPSKDSDLLEAKIGENVWWLAVLADRLNLDFEKCVKNFLNERLENMK